MYVSVLTYVLCALLWIELQQHKNYFQVLTLGMWFHFGNKALQMYRLCHSLSMRVGPYLVTGIFRKKIWTQKHIRKTLHDIRQSRGLRLQAKTSWEPSVTIRDWQGTVLPQRLQRDMALLT